MRRNDHRWSRRVAGLGLLTMLVAGLIGGCSRPGAPDDATLDLAGTGMATALPPQLTVNPPDGAAGVSPTEKVTAAVIGGQLTQVELSTVGGTSVAGTISPDGERWSANQPLEPDTSYVLRVGSRSISGQESAVTARFTTLAPGQEVTGKITPTAGESVSADQPVSVLFDKPVTDRVAVERALRVSANPEVKGATQWRSDRELLWRPTPRWSLGSQVTVSLDLYGKQLGNGLVGASDLRTTFAVPRSETESAARSSSSSSSSSAPSTPARLSASRSSTGSTASSRSVRPSSAARPGPGSALRVGQPSNPSGSTSAASRSASGTGSESPSTSTAGRSSIAR